MNKIDFIIAGLFPNLVSASTLWVTVDLFKQGLVIFPTITLAFVILDRILVTLDQPFVFKGITKSVKRIYSALFLGFLNMNEKNQEYFVSYLELHYLLIYYPLLMIFIDLSNNQEIISQNRFIIIFTYALSLYFIIVVCLLYSRKQKSGGFLLSLLADNLKQYSITSKIIITILMLLRCSIATSLIFGVVIFCLTIVEIQFYKIYIACQFIKNSNKKIINWVFASVLDQNHFSTNLQTISLKKKYKCLIASKATLITKSFFIFSLIIISTYFEDKRPFFWSILLQTDYIIHNLRHVLVSEKIIFSNDSINKKKEIIPFIKNHLKYNCHIYVDYKRKLKQNIYEQLEEEDDKDLSFTEQIILLKLLAQFKDKSTLKIIKYNVVAKSDYLIFHRLVSLEAVYYFLYEAENIAKIFLPNESYLNLDFQRILINRSMIQLNDDYDYQHFPGYLAIKQKIKTSQLQILAFHKLIIKFFEINPSQILYDLYGWN